MFICNILVEQVPSSDFDVLLVYVSTWELPNTATA